MCINFIRAQSAASEDVKSLLERAAAEGLRPWREDQNMQPALQNDALLTYDWDVEDDDINMR